MKFKLTDAFGGKKCNLHINIYVVQFMCDVQRKTEVYSLLYICVDKLHLHKTFLLLENKKQFYSNLCKCKMH
jgi:hypothetical protein